MLRIGILISGGGTTAEAIIKSTQSSILKEIAEVAVVIASHEMAGGIAKARALGVPVEIVSRETFDSQEAFGEKLVSELRKYDVDLVSQNGWLPLTPKNVIEAFKDKIINQHPGPLDPGRPDFGGKGMFGARVICSRLLYCWLTREPHPWTESTVHHVTEHFDKGSLIRVAELPFATTERKVTVDLIEGSTPVQVYIQHETEKLQKELISLEHENLIQTIAQIARREMPSFTRQEPLVTDTQMLIASKRLAIKLFPEG